jgi:hypothetical protein
LEERDSLGRPGPSQRGNEEVGSTKIAS